MNTDWVIDSAQGTELTMGGRAVTSFASANYLSFEPPCTCRSPAFGGRQTLGLPGFLARDADSAALERELAAWFGHASALLGKSTFHLLVDLMKAAREHGPVLVHRESYILTRLAARTLGPDSVTLFGSVRDARRLLAGASGIAAQRLARRRPSVFVDGWSLRGTIPPLAELAHVAASAGGRLVVDDTQALGVLGSPVVDTTATRALPFGSKGTGTLAFLGVPTDAAVVVGSLGKAFGIPMAFAAGPEKWIRHTRASGPLLRASSQVPLGLVRAARYALTWNSNLGDTARRQLTRAVEQFSSLPRIQGAPHSPVQRLVLPRLRQAHALWQELLDRGIWSLLERDGRTGGALTFLLTAAHEGPAIARCRAKLESLQGGCVW